MSSTFRNQQRMKKELPSKQAIEKELDELEAVLVAGRDSPPVVFCHGDLCPANITFDPLRRSATFAAPEYAGANYQVGTNLRDLSCHYEPLKFANRIKALDHNL